MFLLPRPILVLLAVTAIGLALFPLVGQTFYVRLVAKILVLAIFAISLDLLVGFAGMVSLGHAAFFGIGAYVAAALMVNGGISALPLLLIAVLAAAGAAALIIGWFSIRVSGIYFIMVTLGFAQLLFYFFHDQPFWGGADGINLPRSGLPKVIIGGRPLVDLADRKEVYYLTLASLVGCFLLAWWLGRAPFGRVLIALRINERRVRALGYDVDRYKLSVFVIAGLIAGYAGFLETVRTAFVTPDFLSWHHSALILIVVLLGGMGTLFGPVLGAFVLVLLEDWVSGLTERWPLVMGLFVLVVVFGMPHGLANAAMQCRSWQRRKTSEAAESEPIRTEFAAPVTDERKARQRAGTASPILETRAIFHAFGALIATDNVSLAVAEGTIHAVIGPNGAGKSTLIDQLAGELTPMQGQILFKGRNITGSRPHQIARLGIGRSYQRSNVFNACTCLDNCWLGAHARAGQHGRSPRLARDSKDTFARAAHALDLCGLRHRKEVLAGDLSYGEQRQLELAMVLASGPELLLLDEPLAGLGNDEARAMMDLLQRLARKQTLILVEHDMDAVFALADRLTVMVNGRVLMTGTVDEVRASPEVQEAYLGETGQGKEAHGRRFFPVAATDGDLIAASTPLLSCGTQKSKMLQMGSSSDPTIRSLRDGLK